MTKVKSSLKIAHFGAFNHYSFGDLIFPHITEHYLKNFQLVHVSPSSIPTKWTDQKKVISTQKAFSVNDWGSVLVAKPMKTSFKLAEQPTTIIGDLK